MFEHMTCLTGFKVLNVRQTLTHCWNAQPVEGLCLWSLAAEQLQVTDCGWPQKPGSGCVRCVGVLRQRWVILIPMYATSPPLSNSSSTISSCNVLTNMHFGLSHLEPPQDVHWSWLVLAVLFDWSPCVCVCVCEVPHLAAGRQDVTVRGEGACCEVTRSHTLTQPLLEASWGQQ